MSTTAIEVRPVRPAAGYQGGKRNLAKRLCALIDATPHRTYVEPFVGMGGVFLRRTRQSPVEVINDLSGDIATFYRVLQEHYVYFMDLLRWRITSRAEFQRLLAIPPERMTDLNRAARFLYLQRISFGGKVRGRTFGVDRRTPGRFDVTKLEPILLELNERLAGVVVEQLPYGDVIRRYDAAETLFYLDPPYWGCEDDYGDDFAPEDFARLADQLAGIAGRFVLSINATPGSRTAFARFRVDDVDTTWTMGAGAVGKAQKVTELVVRNFD